MGLRLEALRLEKDLGLKGFKPGQSSMTNIGALITRLGFWGILYHVAELSNADTT